MAEKKVIRGTSSELARMLMISARRVQQLVNEGVITRQPEGDYLLPEAVAEYYAFKFKSDEDVDYWEEKAKHEKAKRELAEIELAAKKGEMHAASDIEEVMVNMLSNLRTQLLGVPSKLAPVLADQEAGWIEKILTEEIASRLSELSDYSPELFGGSDAK